MNTHLEMAIDVNKTNASFWALVLACACLVALTACGGGGGSTSPPPTYSVGGAVTGLAGSGLVLQNNAGDALAVAASGNFSFLTSLAAGANYQVSVKTQPTNPAQSCVVTNASGTVASKNVTDVAVTCTTKTYSVGGTVTGLAGSGLVLQNNGANDLSVAANGNSFAFSAPVASGAPYDVTVKTQPTAPSQTCAVTNQSGTVGNARVTVAVTCTTTTYSVGGTVTGLTGSGLVLQNNAANDLSVAADSSSFVFSVPVASGAPYKVTIKTQPTGPVQACTVAAGAGTVGAATITTVKVSCTVPTVACGLENGTVVTHTSDISANETWAGNGTVHLIPSSINILAPATVTVQRCAIVKLGAAVEITVKGDNSGGSAKLLAAGDDPNVGEVYFKSSGSGNWGRLAGYNQNSLIELVDTVLTGGGNVAGVQRNATIAMTGASRLPDAVLKVNNVLISGAQGAGIYLSDAQFTSDSQNLIVEGAADYPIALPAMALGSIPSGYYTGNTHDEAYVVENPNIFDNLTISTPLPINFTWDFINVGARAPLYITDLTLTLQAGVTLKFLKGSNTPTLITFGSTGQGLNDYNAALVVNGTAQSPVTFTSAAATPAPGDWAGLNLLTANGTLIDHAIIEYAGGDASNYVGALNCGPFQPPPNSGLRYPHTAPLLVGDSNDLGYVVISEVITNSTLRFNAGNFIIDSLWDSALFGPTQTPTNTFIDNSPKICTQSKNLLTLGCSVNDVDESGCLVP